MPRMWRDLNRQDRQKILLRSVPQHIQQPQQAPGDQLYAPGGRYPEKEPQDTRCPCSAG